MTVTLEDTRTTREAPWAARDMEFTARDGTPLSYRAWFRGEPGERCLVIFHGGHEHSGRYETFVNELDLDGFTVFAWDARGHGRSPGKRGDAEHFHRFVEDADDLMRHIEREHGFSAEDTVALGHSVGSVVVATWLVDYAPAIRGVVLGSPAFHVKLYVPFALPALRVVQRLAPSACVSSYVTPGMLTHDPEEAEARRRDPLISPRIPVRVLTSLFDTARRVTERATAVETPVLMLTAGSDWVVHAGAQDRFFRRLSSRRKRHVRYAGFHHQIFQERERRRPIGEVRRFIDEVFADDASGGDAVAESDRTNGARSVEAPGVLRRVGYGVQRLALRTVGRLGEGIRIGCEHGFDSGPSLDHVYRNRARGVTPLGRLIDRVYLDAIGWRGIRKRRQHLEALLVDAIDRSMSRSTASRNTASRNTASRNTASGGRAHVVDLASGPGLYLRNVLLALEDDRVTALCQDRDPHGLAIGRERARDEGVQGIEYREGDAFDPAVTARLTPRPDVVVVSGLYELFDDNDLVGRSLDGIREALPPGGSLIYTNQPCHPQLDLIANVLTNRHGEPWRMRLRSQAEMDRLVQARGFRKCDMLVDEHGIFTVSRAVKE